MVKKFFGASLVYLVLGLLAQVVTVFDVWLGFNPLAYTAVAATEQLLLLGWLTQLGLALAYGLLLPSTGNSTRGMTVFVLFNLGLPLVIAGQPGLALFGGPWLGPVAAAGALLQLFAGVVFVYDARQRLAMRNE